MKAPVLIPLTALLFSSLAGAAINIPRSNPADPATYQLMETKRDGDSVIALYKRSRAGQVVLRHAEVNCKTGKMRDLGEGEASLARIKTTPTAWFDPVAGSARSDLARVVCSRK